MPAMLAFCFSLPPLHGEENRMKLLANAIAMATKPTKTATTDIHPTSTAASTTATSKPTTKTQQNMLPESQQSAADDHLLFSQIPPQTLFLAPPITKTATATTTNTTPFSSLQLNGLENERRNKQFTKQHSTKQQKKHCTMCSAQKKAAVTYQDGRHFWECFF
eukprot:2074463-Ditylum_brightwellii.AAC.1